MDAAIADLFSRTLAFSFAALPFSGRIIPFSVRVGFAAAAGLAGFAVLPSTTTIGEAVAEGAVFPAAALPVMLRGAIYGLVCGTVVGALFYTAVLLSCWIEGLLIGRTEGVVTANRQEKAVALGLCLWFLLASPFSTLLSPMLESFFFMAASPIPAGPFALLTTAFVRAAASSLQLAMLFVLPLFAVSILIDLLSAVLQRYLSFASMEHAAAALKVPVLLILLVVSLIPLRSEFAAMQLRAAEAAGKLSQGTVAQETGG